MQEIPTSGDTVVKKKSGFGRILFWTIIVVIVAILLNMLFQEERSSTTTSEVTSPAEEIITNYSYTLPQDWDELHRAEINIQSLVPGQKIEFGIVENPEDENAVYFASGVYDRRSNANLVSIYEYKLEDHSFERIFRTTYQRGNPVGLEERILPALHVIGYENGNIILLARDINEPLARCESPYIIREDDARSLLTLNTNDPYAGFEKYQPSEELLSEELERQNDCIAGK